MSDKQTVSINGRLYDSVTGLPVKSVANTLTIQPSRKTNHASSLHRYTQRSKTLNRVATKRPEAPTRAPEQVAYTRERATVAKSPAISRFAPHPQAVKTVARPASRTVNKHTFSDIGPAKHPAQARAEALKKQRAAMQQNGRRAMAPVQPKTISQVLAKQQAQAQKIQQKASTRPAVAKKPAYTPSQVIKNQAIDEALKKAPSKKQREKDAKRSFFARHPRVFSIASASLALIMLAGYFTYLNMPSLSVRVAAAQAGISASYPDYKPDGYRINGPIAANNGKVEINFASTTGSYGFTVTQEKSNWDSSAVVANLVAPESDDSYITTNERGLTIFTYDSSAAWVNGGLLYTIDGDAPLSSEQIRRIATSL